jgi:hypothetical protein
LEATPTDRIGIMTQYQWLTRHAARAGWISFGSQGSHLTEATLATSQHKKTSLRQELSDISEHVDSTAKNGLTFLAPLTYLLIVEELRPEDNLAGVSVSPTSRTPIVSLAMLPARIGTSALPQMRTADGPGLCTEPDRDVAD